MRMHALHMYIQSEQKYCFVVEVSCLANVSALPKLLWRIDTVSQPFFLKL